MLGIVTVCYAVMSASSTGGISRKSQRRAPSQCPMVIGPSRPRPMLCGHPPFAPLRPFTDRPTCPARLSALSLSLFSFFPFPRSLARSLRLSRLSRSFPFSRS